MTQRRSRRAAAAVALAAALALATPAHAAGWHTWTTGPGWIEQAVQWITGVWTGNTTEMELKAGHGIDPNGNPVPTPPNDAAAPTAVDPTSYRGHGIDPDG